MLCLALLLSWVPQAACDDARPVCACPLLQCSHWPVLPPVLSCPRRVDRDEEFDGAAQEVTNPHLKRDDEWDPDAWASCCEFCGSRIRNKSVAPRCPRQHGKMSA